MIAYTEAGQALEYHEYLKTESWAKKKAARLAHDANRCVVCGKDVDEHTSSCHHLTYKNVGHEDVGHDLITLCSGCHNEFHENWGTLTASASQQTPHHWDYYSKEDTAQFFTEYWMYDIYVGGTQNACDRKEIRQMIHEFYRTHERHEKGISEDDVSIFFRNRRIELALPYIREGKTLEEFLDLTFGSKGKAGAPNALRTKAHDFFKKYFDNPKKAEVMYSNSTEKYIENLWDSAKQDTIGPAECPYDLFDF